MMFRALCASWPFRRVLAMATAATLLLMWPSMPAAGDAAGAEGGAGPRDYSRWSSDALIVPWNNLTAHPSLAACPDGSVHVVWVDGREGQNKIYYKKLGPTGKVLVPEMRLTEETVQPNQSMPKALADQSGGLHVLWLGNFTLAGELEDYALRIYHRSFDANGTAVSASSSNWFFLNCTEYPDPIPDLWALRNLSAAIMPDGNISLVFEVAWSNIIYGFPPASCPVIGIMRLGPDGAKLAQWSVKSEPAASASPSKHRDPVLAIDSVNRAHVFWFYRDPVSAAINVAAYDKSGISLWSAGWAGGAGAGEHASAALRRPDGVIDFIYIRDSYSSVQRFSYRENSTPVFNNEVIYTTDFNASGEMVPRHSLRAACDPEGNVIVACEGDPVGDFGPNIMPYSIGIFVVDPGGNVTLREPQFKGESFDASAPPYGPPPFLFPSLAVSPQHELFLCWQLASGTLYPPRPLGLHMVRTAYYDIGLGNLTCEFDGPVPLQNKTVAVGADLVNLGDGPSGNITVNFSVDSITLSTIVVSAGLCETVPLGFNWTAVRGHHIVAVTLDPGADPDDDPSNNLVESRLEVFIPPDLYVTPEDISFSPESPEAGEQVCITAAIHNAGELVASAVVRFLVDGIELKSANGTFLPLDSSTVSAIWPSVAGNHTVMVEVRNCSPPDVDLSNNMASRAIRVRDTPPVTPPDINITYPPSGALLNGTVEVQGTAFTHYTGQQLLVEVRIDEMSWEMASGNASWSFIWDTSTVPDGNHTLEARATVSNVSRSASVAIAVCNSVAPAIWFKTLSPEGNVTLYENQTAQFTAEAGARPAPADGIGYCWYIDGAVSAVNSGLTRFNYTPNFSSSGAHKITVMALANLTPEPLRAYHEWNVTVVNVNRPPVISSRYPLGVQASFRSNDPSDFQVRAIDPDGDLLTYQWALDGISLRNATASSCRPLGLRPGVHDLKVIVSDGDLNATASWTVRVTGPGGTTVGNDYIPCILGALAVSLVCSFALILVRLRGRGKVR